LDVRPRKVSDQLELLRVVIDESRDGVRLFDSNGRVLHENDVAREMLSEHVSDAVRDICRSAIESGARKQAQLNGYSLCALPLPSEITNEQIGMLTIWPRSHALDVGGLRERFGFSVREAEVAILLAARRTDAEIAKELGISWHTVRSHIERIFELLGCHNRREAARLLAHAVT
jgi:DNA-binding CsgD family transcriptional regulator